MRSILRLHMIISEIPQKVHKICFLSNLDDLHI